MPGLAKFDFPRGLVRPLMEAVPELHRRAGVGVGEIAEEDESRDAPCSSSGPGFWAVISVLGCRVPRPVSLSCVTRSAVKPAGELPALMEFTP